MADQVNITYKMKVISFGMSTRPKSDVIFRSIAMMIAGSIIPSAILTALVLLYVFSPTQNDPFDSEPGGVATGPSVASF